MDVQEFATKAKTVLGDRFGALYQFGSNFARGPSAKAARLLMLVDKLDADLLIDMRPLAKLANESNLQLRFDTKGNVFRSADVFPVFSVELLDTKELIEGNDVLADLRVHPEHLRLHIEQTLRGLRRDLLAAYVADEDDLTLAGHLRQTIRKSIYLLRSLAIICELKLSDEESVEVLVDAVITRLTPDVDREIWHRLRKMANFEEPSKPEDLVALFEGALHAFSTLVEAVDAL